MNEIDTEALLRDLVGRCKDGKPQYPRLSRPCRGVGYCLCDGPGCYNCGGSGWQPIPLAEVAGAALTTFLEQGVIMTLALLDESDGEGEGVKVLCSDYVALGVWACTGATPEAALLAALAAVM